MSSNGVSSSTPADNSLAPIVNPSSPSEHSTSSSSSTPSTEHSSNTANGAVTPADSPSSSGNGLGSTASNSPSSGGTGGTASDSGTGTGTGTGASNPGSGSSGPSNNGVILPGPTPTITTHSTTHAPLTTPTTSSTYLSTSSASIPTTTQSTHTSTSGTATVPTTTALAVTTSSSTQGVISTVVTSTYFPAPTAEPTVTLPSGNTDSGPNIGAIIGGIAGGLVGLVVITWLILIPIRKRAARKQEVDWMAFGSENDHHNQSGSADHSLYRTPRAGVGEDEIKAVDKSPEMYQMSNIGSMSPPADNVGTMYRHLDPQSTPELPTNWGGASGYGVASHVVGDMPPGAGYDPQYAAYYQAMAQQQQSQYAAARPSRSNHGSPEAGPQRYIGQQEAWPQGQTSNQSHHYAGIIQPYNPHDPNSHRHLAAALSQVEPRHALQRTISGSAGDQQTMARTFSDRSLPSYRTGVSAAHHVAHLPPVPPIKAASDGHKASTKTDYSDGGGLAYTREGRDTATADIGFVPGLHVVNSDC